VIPLHERNPVGRFNDRADDYVKYRPSYPAAAIDLILEGLGAPGTLAAADVGAGTGISARLIADRGVQVTAVEPGAVMRGAAAPHARVTWVVGTAEATGLADRSVDLVLCAQSFHWFRAPEAIAEFARLLRPGGRLALMWNRRSKTDAFTLGYRQAIADVGGESEVERAPFDPGVIDGQSQVAPSSGTRRSFFSKAERAVLPNAQRLDRDGLRGRACSASYVPKTGPEGARLIELLDELFDRFRDSTDHVTLVYETEIYRATRL
jgi:SAM-dependent methyltransferase